ncbi:HIT domain-containing protein [Candidatus Pacearchaeota archaeon]|nr:HIT domain-containing protein [Candidatus Pacearchaeota archaeon]
MKDDCVFCKISSGKIPSKKIYENHNFFSVPDANPITKGHSLVISKEHFKTYLDIPARFGQELVDCIKNTSIKLMKENQAEGFNVVNNNFSPAGQVVEHVHFHIIPRKKGDKIRLFE